MKECVDRGIAIVCEFGSGFSNLDAVKALLESQRIVEQIIEAMRPA